MCPGPCFAVARASLPSQKEKPELEALDTKKKERSEGVSALAKRKNQSWKLWIRKRKNVARASLPSQKRKTIAGNSGYEKEKGKPAADPKVYSR
jgi:hypothetical protein